MAGENKVSKALNAAKDALDHLFLFPESRELDYTHIDRLLANIVDLPNETKQKNSRRALLKLREWILDKGPGVVLLEVLGQIYWRLGNFNGAELEDFKEELQTKPKYVSLIQSQSLRGLVMSRIRCIKKNKADACDNFLQELGGFKCKATTSKPTTAMQLKDTTSNKLEIVSTKGLIKSRSTSCSQGLIKASFTTLNTLNLWENDLEHLLIDFYIHGLCPGRTLFTASNTYLNILPLASSCQSLRHAILSLSASYMKDESMIDNHRYEEADHFYGGSAVQSLCQELSEPDTADTCFATAMLLVHHDIINQSGSSTICWSVHNHIFSVVAAKNLVVSSDASLFLRHQMILARTFQTLGHEQMTKSSQQSELIDWTVDFTQPDSNRICGILGLSQQLLYIISSITSLLADAIVNRPFFVQLLVLQLQNLRQWTSEVSGRALEVTNVTAECFRVATQIYLQCRILNFTRSHPSVKELNQNLSLMLLSLPVEGPLYTATYPIWPFFIAGVTCNSRMRDTLLQRVLPIKERDKTSFSLVLQKISSLRKWLESQSNQEQDRVGWWEEMIKYGQHDNGLLCLG